MDWVVLLFLVILWTLGFLLGIPLFLILGSIGFFVSAYTFAANGHITESLLLSMFALVGIVLAIFQFLGKFGGGEE